MTSINKRPWNDDEVAALKQGYETGTPTLSIAQSLGRTHRSVRGKAHTLGLSHHARDCQLYTPEEDRFILQHAHSMTRAEIARALGRSEGSVNQRGQRLNVAFQNPLKQAKYEKDHDFFRVPSLENSYLAGLLAADGWIRPESAGKTINQVGISLKAQDRHLLEYLRTASGYTGVIREYRADEYPQTELRISGVPQWIEDLERFWNLTPNKTFSLQPPNEALLTPEQILAFHVGLIEGDGFIGITGGTLKIEMVTASESFADWLEQSWGSITQAQPSRYLHRDGRAHYVSLYGANARRLCRALLATGMPRLMRKWNTAISEIEKFR
ncbi:hypothetical protein [Marinobacterium sediminicola]|uniref:GcrA cell cycle regulator n=1 Tax=Marinobacterium sediminicola TaxID=518898 RepID=A0ABY1S2S5_9GAMM|nr:hypothetical protein [Marinobacterium sediminicola]ULG68832.1 hypothetical protein LN244_14215 [Marinobacterium sediminicola]SMR77562.1 GcrA cell cycle regulator [Marinobacterium sediminicola]